MDTAIARAVSHATEHAPALAHAAITSMRSSGRDILLAMADTPINSPDTSETVLAELEQAVQKIDTSDLEHRKEEAKDFFRKLALLLEDYHQGVKTQIPVVESESKESREEKIAELKAAIESL